MAKTIVVIIIATATVIVSVTIIVTGSVTVSFIDVISVTPP